MSPGRRRTVAIALLRLGFALIAYTVAAVLYRFGSSGRPGLLAALVATVAVAVLLHLAEGALGRLADRIAYGKRAESQRVVRGLLRRMASTLPVDEVVPRLAQTAGRTVGGPRAAVTLTLADGQEWTQVWPPHGTAGDSVVSAGVHHQGVAIGAIEVNLPAAEIGATERRLLDALAAPAGLALSTVRLTVDLRRRIAELERANATLLASRDRLRTAREDEQRRLRREVEQHVLQHLTSAEEALDAVPAPPDARSVAAARCEQALAELRLIARGIYPSRLGEAGLLVSLDGWLERARTYADIRADTALTELRVNPELEACVYFCAVTALDAFAAAGASSLVAEAGETDTVVTLDVRGKGGGELSLDALTSLHDRIEAFDGTLVVSAGALSFRAPLRTDAAVAPVPLAEVAR
jgi:hypothetical protein